MGYHQKLLLICQKRHEPEVVDEEHREDALHPVEAEPLGCLVPDDVGNARRHFLRLKGSRGVGRVRHGRKRVGESD